jgi:4-hydroxybenzoate polyprenyltransferase
MQLAAYRRLAADRLPFRQEVLGYLTEQKARGRKLVLATAAPEPYASAVAEHLGFFDAVLSTSEECNLKGAAKRDAIIEHASGEAFSYAGDSAADGPIWEAADTAVFVNAPRALVSAAQAQGKCERVFGERSSSIEALITQMRPHQWVKNLLVLVPLFTAHLYFDPGALGAALLAFALFSLCASGVYFLNDLLDLDADRRHRSKRYRPLASGRLSIGSGIAGAVLLPLLALFSGWVFLPAAFTLTLLCYYLVTTLYSLYLKRRSTADVMTLALLYTARIAAGASAIAVTLSPWLLGFSLFFFVNLAYLKRYIELADADRGETVRGRNYSGIDAEAVFTLGTGAATTSVLVFALFLGGESATQTYAHPELLWLIPFLLLYWTHRLWIGGRRRKIHDDPIVFAVKDRVSILVGAAVVVLMLFAHHLP